MAIGLFWATISLCIFVTVLALDIMGFLKRSKQFDVDGRVVVITGGSQGMGRGLGKLLAEKGANVVIVARNKQKLTDALLYISAAARDSQKQRFHSISADVTIAEENVRIISEVTAWNNGQPPDIVWANAGSAHPSLFIDTPLEIYRSQMDMNYFAAMYLAHTTLRAWLTPVDSKTANQKLANAQPRHFIMTGSVACLAGIAGYAPYAPAKAALRSLADTLRSEINLYNGYRRRNPSLGPPADIKVHCVLPGTIKSPGLVNENKTKPAITLQLEDGDIEQTEDEVAAAAVKGLERGGFLVTTQILGYAMKVGMLGNSPRSNIVIDTLFGWIIQVVWLFLGPDMEGKVFNYGKKGDMQLPKS